MRLLLVSEAVTLAHSARMATLGIGLAQRGHEVVIAGADRIVRVEQDGVRWVELGCIGSARFTHALAVGSSPYSYTDIRGYVDADLKLLGAVQPALVIGDFRTSLSISARQSKLPFWTLTNAYWSPRIDATLPMPVLPISKLLPLPLARALYGAGLRPALAMQCRPWNRARRARGLPSLGANLKRLYTDADRVLFADVPELFPGQELPPDHHFLGAIAWSPRVALPPWWRDVPDAPPLIYLTLGSSGSGSVLKKMVTALQRDDISLIVATAGSAMRPPKSANVFGAPYLPGALAAERAAVVVCNGGSMGCQQALMAGKPVLGIASNMDQFLNMQAIESAGAGICIRADRVHAGAVRTAASELVSNPAYRLAAARLGASMRAMDPVAKLDGLLKTFVGEV